MNTLAFKLLVTGITSFSFLALTACGNSEPTEKDISDAVKLQLGTRTVKKTAPCEKLNDSTWSCGYSMSTEAGGLKKMLTIFMRDSKGNLLVL